MPEIGTSGSMSGERKRSVGPKSAPQATAPLLDSTVVPVARPDAMIVSGRRPEGKAPPTS